MRSGKMEVQCGTGDSYRTSFTRSKSDSERRDVVVVISKRSRMRDDEGHEADGLS